VRQGIERRLVRLREVVAEVRGYAEAGRWAEAGKRYEYAEQVAVNLDNWVARGRAEAGAAAKAAHMARLQRSGNERKQRLAARRAKRYVKRALELKEKHDDWSRESIIAEIRRRAPSPPAAKTLRTYLKAAGVK
jgi:hypothetical protein